ncbi:MAG: hypothetical protein GY898_33465 [Proteobacteria bacterium]|nr:hypothetical protein [Pseudomonadota bacterium]
MSVARQCPQCGAQVELPPERISDACAFCATPLVDGTERDDHADLIAPFDLPQVVAARRLGQHMQDKWFLPSKLKTAGKPESLHGVLVPFWSYDATARSDWTARQGITWTRIETYTTVVDGKTVTRTRTVTETEWFDSSGSHVATYDDHLVSGSRGLSEAEANELEPFDLGKALPFSAELLAGWVAEAPTVPRTEARDVANQELADNENSAIARFLPADRTSGVENTTSIQVTELKLVLLPVWIGTWRYKGEPLRLLVNAQTGEVVGDLPTDWLKVTLAVMAALIVTGGFGLMAMLILAILGNL